MRAQKIAAIVIAAGTAVTCTGLATAQTAFSWIDAINGTWSNTANWTPTGSPGAASPLDTALLGLTGPYTVNLDVSRTLDTVTIENPEATLLINPGSTLTITSTLGGDGTALVSNGDSFTDATIALANNATASGNIVLDGFGTDDARVAFPGTPGESAALSGTVSGVGTITGFINHQGTIRANAGDTLVLLLGDAQLTGGTVDQDPAGNIVWNSHTLTNVTLTGDVRIDPGEQILVSSGVSFASPVRVSNGDSFSNAAVVVLDGISLNADIQLNGFGTDDARLTYPSAPGESATLAAGSSVSGVGTITGSLINEGLIDAQAGDVLVLSLTDAQLSGGTVNADPAGDIVWNNHLLSDITLTGFIRIDPGETIRIQNGVTFDSPVNISTGNSFANAVLRVLNGTTMNADVVLNGFGVDDARLSYPTEPGESAVISATSTVVGVGTIDGRFNNQGLIHARSGDVINLAHADLRISGGTLMLDPGGDFIWNSHTLADTNLVGNVRVDPGETIFIDDNVVFNDGVTISNGNSFADATLAILDGVTLDAAIVLDGFGADDARLAFPAGDGESATLAASATVTGTGTITGRFFNAGVITADGAELLALALSEATLQGGTLRFNEGGNVIWNSHTLANITIEGNAIVEPGESVFLSTGASFTDRVTVSTGDSFADATVNLLPGVIFNDTATLRGFQHPDARLAGPAAEGTAATIGASATIEGQGAIIANIPTILGTLSPGTDATPQRLHIDTAGPAAFGPSTVLEITVFAPGTSDVLGGAASLTLAGTLALVPSDDYAPSLGDEFIVLDGPARTGTFDTVAPLPGTTPYIVRARYEPTRVTAIITCLQDLSGDGVTDIDDVLAFLNAFGNQDAIADLALPIGEFNIDDVLTFLDLFVQGCF